MNLEYHRSRLQKRAPRYRLRRRTREVVQAIRVWRSAPVGSILDLGTADGLMLGELKNEFPSARCVGVEKVSELAKVNGNGKIKLIRGDVEKLPLADGSFDVAVATAVVEHLLHPTWMLREAYRVLREGGLFVLTTPCPVIGQLATRLGFLQDGQHHRTFSMYTLARMLRKYGFQVLSTEKFMCSPIGLPLEIALERAMKSLGTDFLLANQKVVAVKE